MVERSTVARDSMLMDDRSRRQMLEFARTDLSTDFCRVVLWMLAMSQDVGENASLAAVELELPYERVLAALGDGRVRAILDLQ